MDRYFIGRHHNVRDELVHTKPGPKSNMMSVCHSGFMRAVMYVERHPTCLWCATGPVSNITHNQWELIYQGTI